MSAPIAPAAPDPTDEPATARVDHLLADAVQETARLLEADGAMVYLVDRRTGKLRFAHDAGIRSERARAWISAIELDPGTGLFGTAVATRSVVVTSDYEHDPSFRHAEDPDRVVADIGIRSMVVAPLAHGDEVVGALGAFSTRTDAFDAAQIALVRSLAEHVEPLTEREKDVIRLLGQGMSNKEIGSALFITERTARTYVSNILGKLGLASRTQAALYAVEHKLVETPKG